jgi:hypothetical protein
MRQELKAKFPGIKFSVRTEVYSGGSSINVHWDMGPTVAAVERVTGKYQQGWFDGMTDSYNYDPTLVIDKAGEVRELGGAKFVFENRHIPEAIETQMFHDFGALWNQPFSGDRYQRLYPDEQGNYDLTFNQIIYKLTAKADLTKGYHGIRRSAETSGLLESMFEMW